MCAYVFFGGAGLMVGVWVGRVLDLVGRVQTAHAVYNVILIILASVLVYACCSHLLT